MAAQCTRPGCGGTIDGGYCTACGLAETPAPVPPPASPSIMITTMP
jgi:serine/threonine-protein kinase PknG